MRMHRFKIFQKKWVPLHERNPQIIAFTKQQIMLLRDIHLFLYRF